MERKKLIRLSDKDKNEAVKLYMMGRTLKEVGNMFNVDPVSVRRFLIRKNLPRRGSGTRPEKILRGEKNPRWKGNDVGLQTLHQWVYKYLQKPETCSMCGKKARLDLANISQKYHRNLEDWEWLCRRCHMTKDGRGETLRRRCLAKKKYTTRTLCSKCERIAEARGMCGKHYREMYYKGQLLNVKKIYVQRYSRKRAINL